VDHADPSHDRDLAAAVQRRRRHQRGIRHPAERRGRHGHRGASNPKLDGEITGTFNPIGSGLLSVFDGEDASGMWRPSVTDDTASDTGTLFGWTLYAGF
jgi:subtilisin-like proprotein convertase family protein